MQVAKAVAETVILGVSFGGAVAQIYSWTHPEDPRPNELGKKLLFSTGGTIACAGIAYALNQLATDICPIRNGICELIGRVQYIPLIGVGAGGVISLKILYKLYKLNVL